MKDHEFVWDVRTPWPHALCSCGKVDFDPAHFDTATEAMGYYRKLRDQAARLTQKPDREIPKFASVEEADTWLEEQAKNQRPSEERLQEQRDAFARAELLKQVVGLRQVGMLDPASFTAITN